MSTTKPAYIKSQVVKECNGIVTTNNEIDLHIQISKALSENHRDVIKQAFMDHPDYQSIVERFNMPTHEILEAIATAIDVARKAHAELKATKIVNQANATRGLV